MTLAELISELGLKVSIKNKRSDEYSSPCPFCEKGNDRFVIWNGQGRFYCRKCNEKGDMIDICKKIIGHTYDEAMEYINSEPEKKYKFIKSTSGKKHKKHKPLKDKSTLYDNPVWQSKATQLIEDCHQNLLSDKRRLDALLNDRGFTLETVKRFRLGWNNKTIYCPPSEWGVDNDKDIYIPEGYLVPYIQNNKVLRLRFRQLEKLPKYIVVKNSNVQTPFIINKEDIVIIVESDFDSILISQEIQDAVTVVSLGSCTYRPSSDTGEYSFFKKAKMLLISLDDDEAGDKNYEWWKTQFSNAYYWPLPYGKDPGEAYKSGLDIPKWILSGIEYYLDEKN